MSAKRLLKLAVCLLLVAYAASCVGAIFATSPTIDEFRHLQSGLRLLRAGDPSLHAVNPPFVKATLALPLLAVAAPDPEDSVLGAKAEAAAHQEFLARNASSLLLQARLARLVNLAFFALGGWALWSWSRALFGGAAGWIALLLWAECPNVMAWTGVATVDLGATAVGFIAAWLYWRHLRRLTWGTALAAGLTLGLALLSKFTLLGQLPVLLLVTTADLLRRRDAFGRSCVQAAVLFAVAWAVLNSGYLWRGVGRPLGAYVFKSGFLSGGSDGLGNRFRGSWAKGLPVPLPAACLLGLDEQLSHGEGGFRNYLCGEWKHGGWAHYYLVGLLVKVPLGTTALAVTAATLCVGSRRFRGRWTDEALIWGPAAAMFVGVSSQTGVNGHFRYVLPVLPFLFLGASRLGVMFQDGGCASNRFRCLGIALVVAALSWNAVSVLGNHPHYLAYFNESAGGAEHGHEWLLESNLDWGQDLLAFREWLRTHPEARPMTLAYYGGIHPRLLGVDLPPPVIEGGSLAPGWHAVSANFVMGMTAGMADDAGGWTRLPPDSFALLRGLTPAAKAGRSIWIFRVP